MLPDQLALSLQPRRPTGHLQSSAEIDKLSRVPSKSRNLSVALQHFTQSFSENGIPFAAWRVCCGFPSCSILDEYE